jgi:hypothetical protein
MSSMNLPVASPADAEALGRAFTTVAEQRLFAIVDPVPDRLPAVDGPMLSARVSFEGSFTGSLICRMPRALALELTSALTCEELPSDGPTVDDFAGEFANMVCSRWLTDVAPRSLFLLEHPVVSPITWRDVALNAPTGLLNGQPVWIELTLDD